MLKDTAQKVQVGQERFSLVQLGPENNSAVIVEDVQERGLPVLAFKPAMRRRVILPKLAYLLSLPTMNRLGLMLGFLSC